MGFTPRVGSIPTSGTSLRSRIAKARSRASVLVGCYTRGMPKAAYLLIGIGVLLGVTFANPLAGNVLGFCPPSAGTKAVMIDGVVTLVDASCLWLIYKGVRAA